MILLNMSSKTFHSSSREKDIPLEEIYDEVMEHMRSNGHFDEARVNSMEAIWNDPYLNNIKDTFVSECEQFCGQVDLGQNRNTLRAKLATRFDSYSSSRRDLKSHIGRCLQERSDEIRSKYYNHARAFLQRYLPRPSPEPETNELDNNIKTETHKEPQLEGQELERECEMKPEQDEQELQADIDMDIESISTREDEEEEIERPTYSPVEEVERPAYSPVGNSENSMNEIQQPTMTITPLDEISPGDLSMSPGDVSAIPLPAGDPEIQNDNSWSHRVGGDDSNLDSDDDERLTFSSISSIKTAELSDWENSIKLSDDEEACVVGKPKNSKVPIKELLDNIEKKNDDLQTTNIIDIETEPMETNERPSGIPELLEASESDGGCSETNTTGRRLARTRKTNSRYSGQDWKLYN